MELAKKMEEDPNFQFLQEKLERAEAKNCELEGDILDRGDKLSFCRDQRIPELIEENQGLWVRIETLASADLQIAKCEAQLAEGREKAEEAAVIGKLLSEAKEREARVHAENEVLQAKLDRLESERNAAEVVLRNVEALGFERCKELVAVLEPELPLNLMSPEHGIFEGKVVKRKEGRPLGEAEILFVLEAEEESK